MKKLLLILTFVLSIFTLGDSNKLTKPSKFLLKEIIPELTEVRPSEEYTNPFGEVAHKTQLEVYKNNKLDSQKVKNYNEKSDKIKVTYYYSKNKLGKIVKEVMGEKGQELEIYYLKENNPFYVVLKNIIYEKFLVEDLLTIEDLVVSGDKKWPVFKQECYFADGKLYLMTDGGDTWIDGYLIELEADIKKKLDLIISKQ